MRSPMRGETRSKAVLVAITLIALLAIFYLIELSELGGKGEA